MDQAPNRLTPQLFERGIVKDGGGWRETKKKINYLSLPEKKIKDGGGWREKGYRKVDMQPLQIFVFAFFY